MLLINASAMFDRFGYFKTADHLKIRWALKKAAVGKERGTVLLVGGRTEFIEKYSEVAEDLAARGFMTFSMDWRGQGGSSRLLSNPQKGHVGHFEDYLDDLHQFVTEIVSPAATLPLVLLAHSMGGHLGLRYIQQFPRVFERAVLSSPMVDIAFPRPMMAPVRILCRLMVSAGYKDTYAPGTGDYVKRAQRFTGNRLTSDRKRFERTVRWIRSRSELALSGVTFGWLDAAFNSIQEAAAPGRVEAVDIPFLVICALKDTVVSVQAQQQLCRRNPLCRLVTVEDGRHEILMETDDNRRRFWAAFDRFVP